MPCAVLCTANTNAVDNDGGGHDNCRSYADCNCNLLPFDCMRESNKWFLIYVIVSNNKLLPRHCAWIIICCRYCCRRCRYLRTMSTMRTKQRSEAIKKKYCAHDSCAAWSCLFTFCVPFAVHCIRWRWQLYVEWVEMDEEKNKRLKATKRIAAASAAAAAAAAVDGDDEQQQRGEEKKLEWITWVEQQLNNTNSSQSNVIREITNCELWRRYLWTNAVVAKNRKDENELMKYIEWKFGSGDNQMREMTFWYDAFASCLCFVCAKR